MTFRQILFPVDFSDRCNEFAPEALNLATHFHAGLTLLHVLDVPSVWYCDLDGASFGAMVDIPALYAKCSQQLIEWKAAHVPNFPAKCLVVQGDPARVIIESAKTEGCDLIVMPTHGYGPFRRALLGSVTAKVLHDSECPVWTAAHSDSPRSHLNGGTNPCVLAAIDETARSIHILRDAAEVAESFRGSLLIGHVMPAVDAELGVARRFARDRMMELQQDAGITAPLCLEVGEVAERVGSMAELQEADLIVIGRGHLKEPLGRLRSNTYGIIRKSACPVLSF